MRVYIEDNMLLIKKSKTFQVHFDLPKNVGNVSSLKLNLS